MTYVGSRSVEIETMLRSFSPRSDDRGPHLRPPTAGTDRAVAVDADDITPGEFREDLTPLRDDVDAVEQVRQNRLRSWQTPTYKAR